MNLANKITLFRIALVPFLILFMYLDNFWTRIVALLIFVCAALSDTLDGRIARRHNLVTTLGKFLDPLADKLLISAAFISFVGLRELHIHSWMVVLIISREFIITGLRTLAAAQDIIIAANMSGKIKTTWQITTIIILMVILIVNSGLWHYQQLRPSDLLNSSGLAYLLGWILAKLPYWLMLATTLVTVLSGLSYMNQHKDLLKE